MPRRMKLMSLINAVPIIGLTSEEIAHIVLGFIRFAYRFGRVSLDTDHSSYEDFESPFLDLIILHEGLYNVDVALARNTLITEFQIRTGRLVNHNLPILLDQFGNYHLVESIVITLPTRDSEVEDLTSQIFHQL